jgi:hypothetical protein
MGQEALKGIKALVFVKEALTQVEDGRRPQPYEDRRLTLA